jgi:uncharacterized protein (TIGR02145 family)
MKKAIFLIFVYSVCPFAISFSQEKLEIEGAVILKNSEDATPEPGTIRFNPTTCDFEGWNGVFWASLTGFRLGSVTDVDGNVYKTVTIGTQEWMAQNLRTTKYKNGDGLPNVTNYTDLGNLGSGTYCWYNNDNSSEQPYGKLYNWYAVNDGRGLCPTGWHVPSDAEWTSLTEYLGGAGIAGGKMKEAGTTHWNSPNTGATNESGFTGLPGGLRITGGIFFSLGLSGVWWSSTESSSGNAWVRDLGYNNDDVSRANDDKRQGFSVRYVRD